MTEAVTEQSFDYQTYLDRQRVAAKMGGDARAIRLSPKKLRAIALKGGRANARKWRERRRQQRYAELAASFGGAPDVPK